MIWQLAIALSALALAAAQVPNLGYCREYVPMADFDMNKFLGVWYEAERYFQLSEVISRCVMSNYTLEPDGKLRVSNEVRNRYTGIKRILEGEIKQPSSKADAGKLLIKYTTIPFAPETKYSILETDYDSFAVLWSCTNIGPLHTQNAWLMTRERLPPGEVMQKAYGVLDKYKISKTFFVKTDQEDCSYSAASTEKPAVDKPTEAPAQPAVEEPAGNYRAALVPEQPEAPVEAEKPVEAAVDAASPEVPREGLTAEVRAAEPQKNELSAEDDATKDEKLTVEEEKKAEEPKEGEAEMAKLEETGKAV
ncbi:hypothetical protein KM043_007472 [Ampulex compressa]|nr:hypothetical protein KM043_007472 [Ampulex compressa]